MELQSIVWITLYNFFLIIERLLIALSEWIWYHWVLLRPSSSFKKGHVIEALYLLVLAKSGVYYLIAKLLILSNPYTELRLCTQENDKFCVILLKSTQYKKLAPNALRFTYKKLKSCKSHETNETKNIRPLVFSFSSILIFYVFFFKFLLQDFKI